MKKSEEKDLLDDIARIGRRVDSIWDGIALFMVIIIGFIIVGGVVIFLSPDNPETEESPVALDYEITTVEEDYLTIGIVQAKSHDYLDINNYGYEFCTNIIKNIKIGDKVKIISKESFFLCGEIEKLPNDPVQKENNCDPKEACDGDNWYGGFLDNKSFGDNIEYVYLKVYEGVE